MSFKDHVKKAVSSKVQELKTNAVKTYEPAPRPRIARYPDLHDFLRTVEPGEGWVYGEYPAAGTRVLRLSHMVRGGSSSLLCQGQLPSNKDRLPIHLANFQTTFALRFVGKVASASIMWDHVHVEFKTGQIDRVPFGLYQAAADCLLDFDPSLQTIRLGADERAREAAAINGQFIVRNTLEPPAGPAPTI